MAYVNLNRMPSPREEHVINYTMLNGGLNLYELEQRLKINESPEMRNLLWRDGVLCSRDGQSWVSSEELGTGYSMYDRLFNGFLVAHIGSKLYYIDPKAEEPSFTELGVTLPSFRGSWFHYNQKLYYKNAGAYVEITYTNGALSAGGVEGFTPVTVINASPSNGAGDLYQPENRIQAKKTVKYNAESGVTAYHLPVAPVDAVTKVVVDGTTKTQGSDYSVNLTTGVVTFTVAPPVTNPPTNNTVEITYSKADIDGYNSIMKCRYATTYGGTGDMCVVMAGTPAQPNAFFWNGNNIAMDPSYFPYTQYQIAGDTDDPITGFGKQQSFLVIFKERSVGRAKQDMTTVDGRIVIDMPYVAINDKIGCDLPNTIQLVENNLVWCNKEQGVHILKDSSYAYENNIACVSVKVNSGTLRPGLLADARSSAPVSLDDTKRYYMCCDGAVWVWDYLNTSYKDPSWYYLTNINAVAFAVDLGDVWHLDAHGRLTHFARTFMDYDQPIDKFYRFAPQFFGGYDRLKNVNSIILVMRPDTNSEAILTYITDYESRRDLTNLLHLSWMLVPRNLTYRSLAGVGFGAVFRRRPMCRRVKHFAMQLENAELRQDLSIVSAQIFYNYQGRLR